MTETLISKTCKRCGEPKDLNEFPKASNCKDGCRMYCKACKYENDRQRYAENLEHERKKARQRYYANAESKIEQSCKWKRENPEAVREYSRKRYHQNPKAHYGHTRRWAKSNPEAIREINRRWNAANPNKAAARCHIRRARMYSNGLCMTPSEYADWIESQVKVCFYCESDCGDDFHVDHIQPLSKGGVHQSYNLAIACPKCNHTKSSKDPEQFLKEIIAQDRAATHE